MLDLCTVTNARYLRNAIMLAQSYVNFKHIGNIYIYYFEIDHYTIQEYKNKYSLINFIEVPKLFEHSYYPSVFWYKTFALSHFCDLTDNPFIYSDATNLFLSHINLSQFFEKDCIFLPYTHPKLKNLYWTTELCFNKTNSTQSQESPQYWAGFQGYRNTSDNKAFIKLMYKYMCDPDIALPGTDRPYPDGKNNSCLFHRCDQSVLSVMIDQHKLHPKNNIMKDQLIGDRQTIQLFDSNAIFYMDPCLSARHTKYINL